MSKNLNSITPGFRDYSLNQNIGKYSQITQSFIYPIGNFIDIYGNVEIKKESLTPNGLLDYVNDGVVTIVDDIMSYTSFDSSAYDEYTDIDKEAIVRCWETVNELLAEGLDPTSEDLLPF